MGVIEGFQHFKPLVHGHLLSESGSKQIITLDTLKHDAVELIR